jgi:hypothetical protein
MSTPILPFAVWASGTLNNANPANDNSLRLQILNGLVISDSTDAQPGSPADGDIYIITGAASGAQWVTFDEFDLAIFDSGTWYAFAPAEGIVVNIAGSLYAWDGAAYVPASGAGFARIAIQYEAELGSTADSDPGPGLLKWNNATQASATVLYLDDASTDGATLTGIWAALDAGGFIYLQHATDQDTWQIWDVTAVVDAAGYAKLSVTLLAKSTGNFADADPMLVQIEQGSSGSGAAWGSITGTLSSQTDLQTALDARDTRGKQAIYVSAGAIRPSVTGGCAALAAIASASNQPDIVTLDFDPSTQEYAQFGVVMPKKWNEGTVTFKAHWSHASTTTNFGVVWDLQAVAVSDDDAIAAAFGTAQTSTDTGGTTNDLYTSPESSAITVAGSPAAEDMVFFRLSRVTGNGSDTMAVEARLHGITLYVTTDASTDA